MLLQSIVVTCITMITARIVSVYCNSKICSECYDEYIHLVDTRH